MVVLIVEGRIDAELVRRPEIRLRAQQPDVGLRPLEKVLILAEHVEQIAAPPREPGCRERDDVVAIRDPWCAGERNGVHDTSDRAFDAVVRIESRIEAKGLPKYRQPDHPAPAQVRTGLHVELLVLRVALSDESMMLVGEIVGEREAEAFDLRVALPVERPAVIRVRANQPGTRDEAAERAKVRMRSVEGVPEREAFA